MSEHESLGEAVRRGEPMSRSTLHALQQEIDHDRRAELRLIPLALVAVAVIGAFVALRWIFFV